MTSLMADGSPARRADRSFVVPLFYIVFLLFHLYTQIERINNVPIPNEYDELQHVSFAISQKMAPTIFPEYEGLRLIDLGNPAEFTTRPNYLNHPSFYYSFLSLFVSGDTSQAIFGRLRLVNLGLSTLALSLLFSFGMVHLKEPREHLGFGLVVVLCPTIAALGGQVSNDNMAFLGGVIALIGMVRLGQGRVTAVSAAVIGIGFAVAALTKLTAGLLVGICILAVHGWMVRAFRPFDRRRLRYVSVLAIFMIVGIIPYLHNLAIYHAPLYLDMTVIEKTPGALDFWEFLTWFAYGIPASWSVYPPANAVQMITLALVVGLAGYGAWHHLRSDNGGRRAIAIVTAAGGLAVFIVIPIHFAFAYDLHVETGHHGGPHIRYYMPMWGAVMFGVALGLSAIAGEARKATALILLLVMMTYSNVVSAHQSGILEVIDRLCVPLFECDFQQ